MSLTIRANESTKRKPLLDYLGGVMDTVGGSAGSSFTYLPIVFQDDCQVCDGASQFGEAEEWSYSLVFEFL
jgi:hypothetical protein